MTRPDVLPSAKCAASAPRIGIFRGSMAGLCAPLSTLRRNPRGQLAGCVPEDQPAFDLGRCATLYAHGGSLVGGAKSLTPLNSYFFVARRLVAAALLARDPAAVVPFNRGSHHAAALSWADGDTAWTDANRGVGVIPATVPTIIGGVVDMQPGLHIDLGHLDALGLGRSGERGSRQHRCRHDKSDFHHGESSLAPIIDFVWRHLLLLVFRSHQSNATPIRRAFRQTT